MTRLVIAHTPYHVLLATAGLKAREAGSNHLIIIADFDTASQMAVALVRYERTVYETVTVCGGTYGITSRFRRQLQYRQAIPEMRRRTRELQPTEIWVGNDARPESQAAFRSAARGSRNVPGVYVEDGLTAYASSVRRPLKPWEHLAGFLLFGRYWSGIEVLGTSGFVSTGVFIYPELVRDELAHLSRFALPRDLMLNDDMRELASQMLRASTADASQLRTIDAIVTVSHSSVGGGATGYREGVAAIVRRFVERGCRVGIKYHPREAEPDYLGLARGDAVLLPQGLPLEYLYILSAARASRSEDAFARLRYVIGDVSTTLLTARWLVPDARCVSLARPLHMLNGSLESLFMTIGVQLPATLDVTHE